MAQKLIKRKRNAKSRLSDSRGLAALVGKIEKSTARVQALPLFKAGDTVAVHVKIKEGDKERVQLFEGLVIGRSNKGSNRSFTVRKISHGYGVERVFVETSPKVVKLDVLQSGRVRRAKLYYIRGLEGRAARIDRDMGLSAAETAAAQAASKKPSA